MNLFAEQDHPNLVGPSTLFEREHLIEEHGDWGHQLLRAATALEMLAQITDRYPEILLKGGTLLQNSLDWPPARASVDLDLEVKDATELRPVLVDIEEAFESSSISISVLESPVPDFMGQVQFHRASGPDWSLRIDALENDHWPSGHSRWNEIPSPWDEAVPPFAAPVEARAAQKLLLAAEPYYGRDLENHLGRQNFVKDLFDLHCLGHETVDEAGVLRATMEDIERKSTYLDQDFEEETILDTSLETYRHFAHPPVDDDSLRGSLWRAYERVKGSIRTSFTRTTLRNAAGCAHHAIESIQRENLDWDDTWRPARSGTPRSAWEGRTIEPVVDVSDDYGPARGPLEAWARWER